MCTGNKKTAAARGFADAEEITQRYAKTFYFASVFLPGEKRLAAYSIYAVCRLSDEAVDTKPSPGRLESIEKNIARAYSGCADEPLLLAFADTVRKYAIPREYFDQLIAGMRMDLEKNRYADFNELYEYCYRAAGVVGLMMLKIFGYRNAQAQEYALKLGIAMQLTNILRDIREDISRGRIYLPADEMKRFSVTQEELRLGKVSPAFKSLMDFQIKRSRSYYAQSLPGIKMISGARCRMVALAMKEIYAAILGKIERSGYDVFSRRARVSIAEKITIAAKLLIGAKFI